MKTQLLSADELAVAIDVLVGGGVVAMPTDTVYGIAALPGNAAAIDAIFAAKGRPADQALPMLVAGLEHARSIALLDAQAERLCDSFWPGALTVVAPAAAGFRSTAIAADGTVAVRMPAHALALRLIAAAGGVLAVTSANRSGDPPAISAQQVLDQLDERIEAVLDGGLSPGGTASTVVRFVDGGLTVLRAGAIPEAALRRAL